MRNDHPNTGRRLTHDELKAAEAAFQGWAFSEAWSETARTVYNGILFAKLKLSRERLTHGGRASDYELRNAA